MQTFTQNFFALAEENKFKTEVDERVMAAIDELILLGKARSRNEIRTELGEKNAALFYKVERGKQSFQSRFINDLVKKYKVSRVFLMMGTGGMFSSLEDNNSQNETNHVEISIDEVEEVDIDKIKRIKIPVISLDVAASIVENVDGSYTLEAVSTQIDTVERIPGFKYTKLTRIYRIKGDSMIPNYYEGEKVMSTWVDPSNWKYLPDDAYVVSTKYGGLMLKRITSLGNGFLLLKSDNPLYSERKITTDDLQGVWKVEYFTFSYKR